MADCHFSLISTKRFRFVEGEDPYVEAGVYRTVVVKPFKLVLP